MTTHSPMPGEPNAVDALASLAERELRAGRLAEAADAFRKILALRPDLAEVHYNLGVVLKVQGKLDEAAAQYERALALKPDFALAYLNLGAILREQRKLDQAVTRYEQALAVRPNLVEALNNLGNVLREQGKLDQALARFEQALALRPDHAEAHNNLGKLLEQQGKFDQAANQYLQAVTLKPEYAEAHNNLGNVLREQGKLDEALARFQQALALRPALAEIHSNLGNVLLDQGKFDAALARYEKALALKPDFAEAHNNLGNALKQQGKFREAVTWFEQALALRPDFVEVQLNLAVSALIDADYERGWPAWEARLRMPGHVPLPSLPRWSGEPLAGRRLLLLAEQGFGDTFHFIRYARLFKERGAHVVLACPPALGGLLASHPDLDELFLLGSAEELPRADFYLPLLSAPGVLHTDAATIPCEIPYLWADAALVEKWRAELAGIDGFKIGIVWQGSRDYMFDRWRSIPLSDFAPLARLPDVRLISLQKGFGAEQIATVDFPVLDLAGRLDETGGAFMDTAAVIRNLDLVVTPDTAIGHLAGALGVPVWLAIQYSPNWRWLLGREDSPWYPTMRLFRQTTLGAWPDVFERMAKATAARQ